MPSLEELIKQRRIRKKELKAAFNGNKNYKEVLYLKEKEVENYINDHSDKLEEVDQKIFNNLRITSTIYPLASAIIPVGLMSYIETSYPSLTRIQKFGLFVPIIIFPFWAMNRYAYNQARINHYLLEKYIKVLSERSEPLIKKINST